MMEDLEGGKRKRRRLWPYVTALVVLLAVVLVPPMVSLNRYKNRVAQVVSESLGRPVHLSAVQLRLLPTPAFELSDLTVEEDPAYGAEPVLIANTVKASIRLFSIWRGRMEISKISVDEASLNLVRTPEGHWNLDSLFRTAAGNANALHAGSNQRPIPFPYLEATNSRVNFKRGVEKLPFSLLSTDLSFWQEQPGEWRIRLRGQPARTDVNLDLADTGIVRLEASVHGAPELTKLPVHFDLDWREAQLGQLTRLLIGSDAGWRGDLTGEIHFDGTAESAQIQTRLRATGVHRAEFAPAAPMDFDASCGLLYHYAQRSLEKLECNSPLGDGRVRITGDVPGNGDPSHLSVELDRIPVGAGLDALRTVRSDFAPGLEVAGSVSGKISYAPVAAEPVVVPKQPAKQARAAKPHPTPGPLTGSLSVQGFALTGDGISEPIQASKAIVEAAPPATTEAQQQGAGPFALQATATFPAGASVPLTVSAELALSGYAVELHGQASPARARELAHVAGIAHADALGALSGGSAALDLSAQGPWLRVPRILTTDVAANAAPANAEGSDPASAPVTDRFLGTVTLRNATWKAAYLANPVEISQAVVHLDRDSVRWDPVSFSYGTVKGTAGVDLPIDCAAGPMCNPKFSVHFGSLDAAAAQAALLGAREPGTLLSTLLARLRPASSSDGPRWPPLQGSASADSLDLGPVTLAALSADLQIEDGHVEISALNADLLGGHFDGGGTLEMKQGKPEYALQGQFTRLKPAAVGRLLGLNWTGGDLAGDGKIDPGRLRRRRSRRIRQRQRAPRLEARHGDGAKRRRAVGRARCVSAVRSLDSRRRHRRRSRDVKAKHSATSFTQAGNSGRRRLRQSAASHLRATKTGAGNRAFALTAPDLCSLISIPYSLFP